MLLEREQRVAVLHPAAVVADAHQRNAPLLDAHRDAAGASVERILDQLLDHRRRPLDYLAGGDAVYSMLVQQPDTPHRKRAVASG